MGKPILLTEFPTPTGPNYEFWAKVLRVIDGDTFVLDINHSFRAHRFEAIRPYGINAPETNRKDQRFQGLISKAAAELTLLGAIEPKTVEAIHRKIDGGPDEIILEWLRIKQERFAKLHRNAEDRVLIQAHKPGADGYRTGKYGRWLAVVWYKSGVDAEWINWNQMMVEQGLAVAYYGGKR